MRLEIRADLFAQMLAQARAEAPLEACGVLGGQAGRAMAVYPLTNTLRSPVRYQADAQALVAALADIEARGWELLAIYHSHPAGPPAPSVTDVTEAYYPEAVYVIISLAHRRPVVRGFRIVDGHVTPVQVAGPSQVD